MIDPVELAKSERSKECSVALSRRIRLQEKQDNATTFTAFWRSFNPATGLHTVECDDGSKLECWSITGTGFVSGNVVTVSRPKGAVFGRIRIRR